MNSPRITTARMSAPPPKTSRPITTQKPRVTPDFLIVHKKKNYQNNEFNTQENLLQEKNNLLNEIKYLESQLKKKQTEMNSVNQQLAHNAESNLVFQQRFSTREASTAAYRRYNAETQLTKLQEIYEQTENKYQHIWSLFSPEQDYKIKAEYTLQKQQLSLLSHEVEELDKMLWDLEDELQSEELRGRIGQYQELTNKYNALREELKKEKQKQAALIDTLRKTKELKATPKTEMENEIKRLLHQLKTMDRVSYIIEKNKHKTTPSSPISPQTPRRNPRKIPKIPVSPPPQPEPQVIEPVIEEEVRDYSDSYSYSFEEEAPNEREEEEEVFDDDFEDNLFNITQNRKFERD